jgi:hypothetical protein
MKRRFLNLASIALALVALGLGYSYFSCRLGFLKLYTERRIKIVVNGMADQGEMLLGRRTAIVTTRQAGRHHSYQLFFAGDADVTGNIGFVLDCGKWVAPHLPILPETPNYPPCKKASERLPLISMGPSMQFISQDHSNVAVILNAY